MSILGNRVLRREDPKFLTVGGTYVDDLRDPRLDGAAYVTFVRSTIAHAKITSIDTSEATAAPGVVAVLTAADLDLADAPPPIPLLNQEMKRPFLARDTVRFVGEPVAMVIADSAAQAEDAAERVAVDWNVLPAIVDARQAMAPGAPLVFDDCAGNLALTCEVGRASCRERVCWIV